MKKVDKTVLSNGVRILTQYMPHVHSVSMGVWVNAGARDETVLESGLSHFIEHMIFKGTERRSAFQIAREFDAIGGYTNAFTSMESTCYHAKVLDTHLAPTIDILADIFLNSRFDAREVERERAVILQEIGMAEDNPDEYVHQLAGQTFWGQNPLGRSILGTRDNILGFDAASIRAFFRRFYQPDRIVIAAAGNVEHRQIVDWLGTAFEAIEPGDGFAVRQTPPGRGRTAIHTKALEQAHLCISTRGLSNTARQRYALSLLNTILGGNMSSRLFQEIREQKGLAYVVYSYANAYFDTGMFGIYAGVDPQHVSQTLDLSLAQMRRLKTEPVRAEELTAAKEFTRGNLLLASESNDNQMVRLAQNEINFGRYLPLAEVIRQIESISAKEIREVADDLFDNRQLAITLLGPVDTVPADDNRWQL